METSGASVAPPRQHASHPRYRCSASFETPLTATISRPPSPPGNVDMQNVNRFLVQLKLDEFFLNWLSSPESQKLVRPIPPHPFPDRRLPPAVVSATPRRSPNPRSTSRARDAPRASPSPPCSHHVHPLIPLDPDPRHQVLNLLDDAKAGRPLKAPALPATPTGQSSSPSSTQALFHSTSLATPPLSPQKSPAVTGSPSSPARRAAAAAAPTLDPRAPPTPSAVLPRRRVGCVPDEASALKLAEAALDGGALDANVSKGDEGGAAPLVLRSASDASHQRDESDGGARGRSRRRRGAGACRRPGGDVAQIY